MKLAKESFKKWDFFHQNLVKTQKGSLECISSSVTSVTRNIGLTGGNIYTFSEELDKLRVHSSREAIEKQVMHIGKSKKSL